VNVEFTIKVFLFLAVFQWITAGVMGMGDAKYLLLLAFLVGSAPLFFRGLCFSLLGAGAICLVYVIVKRSFNIDIPLAPAFTLGFTLAFAL
jgi:Flp pilus assembly protein protease CpaA